MLLNMPIKQVIQLANSDPWLVTLQSTKTLHRRVNEVRAEVKRVIECFTITSTLRFSKLITIANFRSQTLSFKLSFQRINLRSERFLIGSSNKAHLTLVAVRRISDSLNPSNVRLLSKIAWREVVSPLFRTLTLTSCCIARIDKLLAAHHTCVVQLQELAYSSVDLNCLATYQRFQILQRVRITRNHFVNTVSGLLSHQEPLVAFACQLDSSIFQTLRTTSLHLVHNSQHIKMLTLSL